MSVGLTKQPEEFTKRIDEIRKLRNINSTPKQNLIQLSQTFIKDEIASFQYNLQSRLRFLLYGDAESDYNNIFKLKIPIYSRYKIKPISLNYEKVISCFRTNIKTIVDNFSKYYSESSEKERNYFIFIYLPTIFRCFVTREDSAIMLQLITESIQCGNIEFTDALLLSFVFSDFMWFERFFIEFSQNFEDQNIYNSFYKSLGKSFGQMRENVQAALKIYFDTFKESGFANFFVTVFLKHSLVKSYLNQSDMFSSGVNSNLAEEIINSLSSDTNADLSIIKGAAEMLCTRFKNEVDVKYTVSRSLVLMSVFDVALTDKFCNSVSSEFQFDESMLTNENKYVFYSSEKSFIDPAHNQLDIPVEYPPGNPELLKEWRKIQQDSFNRGVDILCRIPGITHSSNYELTEDAKVTETCFFLDCYIAELNSHKKLLEAILSFGGNVGLSPANDIKEREQSSVRILNYVMFDKLRNFKLSKYKAKKCAEEMDTDIVTLNKIIDNQVRQTLSRIELDKRGVKFNNKREELILPIYETTDADDDDTIDSVLERLRRVHQFMPSGNLCELKTVLALSDDQCRESVYRLSRLFANIWKYYSPMTKKLNCPMIGVCILAILCGYNGDKSEEAQTEIASKTNKLARIVSFLRESLEKNKQNDAEFEDIYNTITAFDEAFQ